LPWTPTEALSSASEQALTTSLNSIYATAAVAVRTALRAVAVALLPLLASALLLVIAVQLTVTLLLTVALPLAAALLLGLALLLISPSPPRTSICCPTPAPAYRARCACGTACRQHVLLPPQSGVTVMPNVVSDPDEFESHVRLLESGCGFDMRRVCLTEGPVAPLGSRVFGELRRLQGS
jgi:hypothetical protein